MTQLDITRFAKCRGCELTYPRNGMYFHRDPAKPCGVATICRQCWNRQRRQWRKRTRNQGQNAAYMKEYGRKWRERNPDYMKNYSKAKRAEDKDYFRTAWRRWYKRNARTPAMRIRGRAYHAKKCGSKGEHTFDEVWQMYEDQQGLCAYCETPLFGSFHVDHMIPLSRGGRNSWDNLAVTCPRCNLSKNTKTAEEYMALLM